MLRIASVLLLSSCMGLGFAACAGDDSNEVVDKTGGQSVLHAGLLQYLEEHASSGSAVETLRVEIGFYEQIDDSGKGNSSGSSQEGSGEADELHREELEQQREKLTQLRKENLRVFLEREKVEIPEADAQRYLEGFDDLQIDWPINDLRALAERNADLIISIALWLPAENE